MNVEDVSPAKKNPRGKFIGTGQKKSIINICKERLQQQLENLEMTQLNYRQMIYAISKTTGFGQRTVQTTLSEYKKQGSVSSPNKKKVRATVIQKIDEFDKNAIRQKIHNFWRAGEVPTDNSYKNFNSN